MEFYNTLNVRHLGDFKQFFNGDKNIAAILELLTQENTILDDVPFIPASHPDKNQTVLRRELPEVYWRRLYRGVPLSKSSVDTVSDPMGMLEARSMVDAKLEQLMGARFTSYRLLETQAFLESMKQEAARAIIYGDIKNNEDGIHGLAPRYAFKDGPNVIDAKGSGSECASIWLVIWGPNTAHGIYPPDLAAAGLHHKPLSEQDWADPDGNMFRAIGDLYEWTLGLSVRDLRSVVRIANIDTTKINITDPTDPDYVDLANLLIEAKELLPEGKQDSAKVYMNSKLRTALQLQARNSKNLMLMYGEAFASKNVPIVHGLPVRRVDALLSTEEALPAKPV